MKAPSTMTFNFDPDQIVHSVAITDNIGEREFISPERVEIALEERIKEILEMLEQKMVPLKKMEKRGPVDNMELLHLTLIHCEIRKKYGL